MRVAALSIPSFFPPCRRALLRNLYTLPGRQRRRPCWAALGPAALPKGHGRRVLACIGVRRLRDLPRGLLHNLEGTLSEITRALRVGHATIVPRGRQRLRRKIETDPLPFAQGVVPARKSICPRR